MMICLYYKGYFSTNWAIHIGPRRCASISSSLCSLLLVLATSSLTTHPNGWSKALAFLQLHEDRRPTGSKNANTVRAILPPILNFCEDCEESEDFQKPFQFWFSLAWRSKKIWSRALSLSVVGLSCCLCCRILGCMLDGSAGILYLSISCKWDHLRHSTLRGTIMALLSKRLNANSKLIPQNKAGLIPVIDWLTYIISDLSA